MGLVPVHFSESHSPFGQADTCHAFEFPPTAGPKLAPQPHNISNPTADCDRFNLLDFTDDLNMHCAILRCIRYKDQCPNVHLGGHIDVGWPGAACNRADGHMRVTVVLCVWPTRGVGRRGRHLGYKTG